MKNLNVLEKERLHKENDRIGLLLAIYNDSATDAITKDEIGKRIKFAKRAIGNLPETVRIEIAKHANLFMNGIIESLRFYEFNDLFFEDVNEYLNKVASLRCENNLYVKDRAGVYNSDIQNAILYFNFTYADIKKIMVMTRDEFMEFINKQYGTLIPSIEELKSIEEKRQSCYHDYLEQVKCAKEKAILQVRTGVFIQTQYPLYYEHEVVSYYNKLIEDCENTLKRK